MITLTISCSQCGKVMPEEMQADTRDEMAPEAVKAHIEKRGWVFQINGENVDTYCSKKCAD